MDDWLPKRMCNAKLVIDVGLEEVRSAIIRSLSAIPWMMSLKMLCWL